MRNIAQAPERHSTRAAWLLASWIGGICGLSVLASAPAVQAQQAATAAEALFRAGRDASRRGDTKTACDRYRESYRLEPALGTLFNIASCEIALGELSDAWRHMQEVVHSLPEADSRVAIARDELAKLERRLARLTLTRAGRAPAELEVRLGEVELGSGSFDVALPVEPGHLTIETRAEGREPRRYEVELQAGEQRTLEVDAGPLLPAPAADVAAPAAVETPAAPAQLSFDTPKHAAGRDSAGESNGRRGRTAAWTLLGTGAIGLATAAVCGGFVLDRLSTVDSECDASKRCSPAGLAAGRSGQTFYVTGLVSLGIALVTSGLGAYLLLATPADGSTGSKTSRAATRMSLQMRPSGVAISFD